MDRKRALQLITGGSLASVLTPSTLLGANNSRPNILFIMTDDHSINAMSCYGSSLMRTPNFDQLAREGMRFENCYVTNSLCAPSRAALLTGKYSHKNGQLENGPSFDGSQQTIQKLMSSAGYQTGFVGKWHLNSTPIGFDYWIRLPGQGRYNDPRFYEKGKSDLQTINGYVTDVITDLTIDTINDFSQADDPFLIFSHHKAPHARWVPADEYKDMFKDQELPAPETFYDDYSGRENTAGHAAMRIGRDLYKYTAPDANNPREREEAKYQGYIKDYLAVIKSVDDNIGRLMNYLEQEGLADNTVVIYTSDNGMFLGEHGFFDKRFMYEESLHVPLIARYPKEIPAGSVTDQPVLNIDFAETFLDYAGASVPSDMQGRSLRPLLKGKRNINWRDAIYYHYYEYPGPHDVRPHYGVKTGRYKLIYFYTIGTNGAWELYDLEKDPHEMDNVYYNDGYKDIRIQLRQKLAELRNRYEDETGKSITVNTDLEEGEARPNSVKLGQNYPNPFNPSTRIHYEIPEAQRVRLNIYNSLGQKVETLVNSRKTAGTHTVTFRAGDLPGGIYIYELKTEQFTDSNKMILLK